MGGKGSGRRIDPEKARQLEALGVPVPARLIGQVETSVLEGDHVFQRKQLIVKASRSMAILALKLSGFKAAEIAESMGMTVSNVYQVLYLLRKKGMLSETNDDLDHGIVPKAVEKLNQLVEDGDKDAIFEVLKGRGQFKKHVAGGPGAGAAAVVTNLVVSFQVPEGKEKPVLVGQVVGVPREKGED